MQRTWLRLTRDRFVKLAFVGFALILCSFLIRGTTRLIVGYETAVYLSAPILLAAAVLLSYLVVRGALDLVGIVEITE